MEIKSIGKSYPHGFSVYTVGVDGCTKIYDLGVELGVALYGETCFDIHLESVSSNGKTKTIVRWFRPDQITFEEEEE